MRPAPFHFALEVAEQDDAVLVAIVGGPVDIGFIEDHRFAVAPAVIDTIHIDEAAVIIRRYQAEVIAQ
ncbi:hypothetical protein D3C81_1872130 [compost metagenome]